MPDASSPGTESHFPDALVVDGKVPSFTPAAMAVLSSPDLTDHVASMGRHRR